MRPRLFAFIATAFLALLFIPSASAQALYIYSPRTHHNIIGDFAFFWQNNGQMLAFGDPLTEQFDETVSGKTVRVQYFERAVLEYHPENAGTIYAIQPRLLGDAELARNYAAALPAAASPVAMIVPPTSTPAPPTATRTPTAEPTATETIAPPTEAPDDTPIDTPTETPVDQPTAEPVDQATETPVGAPTATAETPPSGDCPLVPDDQKSTVSNAGPLVIANINYQGEEYVEIQNASASGIDLFGYTLRDKNDPTQSVTFSQGSLIPGGGFIDVYTNASPDHAYNFGIDSEIWNDCGDAAELVDTDGNVVATYAYGTYLQQ